MVPRLRTTELCNALAWSVEIPGTSNVIVVNYGDRRPGEPMTAPPSVGKSAYLKLDAETVRWGIVVPGFEGESR